MSAAGKGGRWITTVTRDANERDKGDGDVTGSEEIAARD